MTQLLQGDTALRCWFEEEFPQAADRLQPDPPPPRIVPLRRPWRVPPWLIGMAFDWRLRLGLEAPHVEGSTAEAGWRHLEASISGSRHHPGGGVYLGPSSTPVHHLVAVATQARGGHASAVDDPVRLAAAARGGLRELFPAATMDLNRPSVVASRWELTAT